MSRIIKAFFGVWAIVGGAGFLFFAFTFMQQFVSGKSETYAMIVWVVAGGPLLLLGWLIMKWGWQFITGQR